MDKYLKLMIVKGLIMSMDEQLSMHFDKDNLPKNKKEEITNQYYDAILEQFDEPEKVSTDTTVSTIGKVIIINGKKHNIKYNKLSYHQILELAFKGKYPNGNYTITFSYIDGDIRDEGNLPPDTIITITDRMLFNVCNTSKGEK